jgi:hypothetical protein
MERCEYCGLEMVLDHSHTGTDGQVYEYYRCNGCDGEAEPEKLFDENVWELTDFDLRFLKAMQISPE